MGRESANREPSQRSTLTDVCGFCRTICGRNRRTPIREVRLFDENPYSKTPAWITQTFTSIRCRQWCREVPTMVPFCFPLDVTVFISLHRTGTKLGTFRPPKAKRKPQRGWGFRREIQFLPSDMKRRGRDSTKVESQVFGESAITTQVANWPAVTAWSSVVMLGQGYSGLFTGIGTLCQSQRWDGLRKRRSSWPSRKL
jgi:hypothetical protein